MKVGWCDERERMPQMWDTSFAIGSLSHFGGSLWTGDEFCEIYWWWKGEVSKYVGCFHWNQQCWFSIFYQWDFGDKLRLVHLRQIKSDEREKRLPQQSALRRQESNNKLSGHVRLSSSVLVVNICNPLDEKGLQPTFFGAWKFIFEYADTLTRLSTKKWGGGGGFAHSQKILYSWT